MGDMTDTKKQAGDAETSAKAESAASTDTATERNVAPPPDDSARAKAKAELDARMAERKELAELRAFKAEQEKAKLSETERAAADKAAAEKKAADLEAKLAGQQKALAMVYVTQQLASMAAVEGVDASFLPAEAFELTEDQTGLSDKAKDAMRQFAAKRPALFKNGNDKGLETGSKGTRQSDDAGQPKGFWAQLRSINGGRK